MCAKERERGVRKSARRECARDVRSVRCEGMRLRGGGRIPAEIRKSSTQAFLLLL